MAGRRPLNTHTRAVIVVVLAAVVLLGSCSSDESTTEAGGTTSSASIPSGTDAPGTIAPTTESTPTTEPATSSTAPATTIVPTTFATPPPTTAPAPTPSPAPTNPAAPPPAPLPAGPNSVFVLGDSVLLGTTYGSPPPMVAALTGWAVTLDCEGSRRLPQGLGVLQARRGEIGRVAVIQLGNNHIPGEGGPFASQIDQAMAILEGTDRVVWVTVGEALSGRAELNADIRAAAARHPTIVVADWAALVAADPGLAPGDGLHLSNEGRVAMSELVATAIGPAPG